MMIIILEALTAYQVQDNIVSNAFAVKSESECLDIYLVVSVCVTNALILVYLRLLSDVNRLSKKRFYVTL